MRTASTLIRDDDQFEHCHPGEFHVVIFRLSNRGGRTEIPLLAEDFLKRPPAIRRPAQDELLCARGLGFDEQQPDAPEPLRLLEDESDSLLSGLCGPPT